MSTTPSQPEAPRSSRHWLRATVIIVGAIVVLAFLSLAVTGALAYREARSLQHSVQTLEDLARARSLAAVPAELSSARGSAHRLRLLTSGPVWWAMDHAPVVGGQVAASRRVAVATDVLLASTEAIQAPLESVARGELRTDDGRVNLEVLSGLASGLPEVVVAVESGSALLATVNPDDLPGPLASPVRGAQEQLAGAAPAIRRASDALSLLPSALGSNGTRRWLVLLQNPAEARPTGGLIGGYAIVTATDGRITLTESGANDTIMKDGPIDTSALPEGVVGMFGKDLSDWRSLNMSPHFPYTGELAAQGMRQHGTPVDGVVAVDPTIVSLLLRATRPVSVMGTEVTADSAVDFVTRQVYVDHRDNAEKDAALLELLRNTLANVVGGSLDTAALGSGLIQPGIADHVRLWSARADEQALINVSAVGGVLPDTAGPSVVIGMSNGVGSKVDTFISTTATYRAGSCPTQSQAESELEFTLRNDAPEGLPEYVGQRLDDSTRPFAGERMLVQIYAPVGATLNAAQINGENAFSGSHVDRGRPVWTYEMRVDRGATTTLRLRFTEPTVPGMQPSLWVQPMVIAPTVSVATSPGCPAA